MAKCGDDKLAQQVCSLIDCWLLGMRYEVRMLLGNC